MNHSFSNVGVVSNVYPITTATTYQLLDFPERTSGVIDDPVFRRRIWCKRSLKKLSDLKGGTVIDDRQRKEILLRYNLVDRSQIEACWDDGRCVDCLPGELPIGPVSSGENTVVECRCKKPNCPVKNSPNS
jgi:hypothetical protein